MELDTARLHIRPFALDDTPAIHRILDLTFGDGMRIGDRAALRERESWVRWQMLNQRWHAELAQPPYGDLAVVLAGTQALIGAVGYTPCLDAFEQFPALRGTATGTPARATAEVGLFWAIDPAYQRRGYATEAARALIEHAFTRLRLKRIIATTAYG